MKWLTANLLNYSSSQQSFLIGSLSSDVAFHSMFAHSGGNEVQPTRIYRTEDAREFLTSKGIDVEALAPHIDGKFFSAFIRAVKP
jgi:hypothetical protein